VQTEEAYWLEEAYAESINTCDTGIMARNMLLMRLSSLIIYFFYDKSRKFLDYAGGYGIFTRLMRDIGFDFYWNDKYSPNLIARGFKAHSEGKVELVTSFEAFEHFDEPITEIESILKESKNILFTTGLISDLPPKPNDWWYYGLDHGQHISFYSRKTLMFIAKKYNLNFYSNGSIHLLTEKKISNALFKFVLKMNKLGLFYFVKKRMSSKVVTDMNQIIENSKIK